MAPDICDRLHLPLLGLLFSLRLIILLLLEAFRRSFKLLLIDYKEVAWTSLREIWLGQDVLDTCDWANVSLLINIFQLVHLIGFINDSVTFLEMD